MTQPNILLITSDQYRADTLSCYGHPCAQTPHLDQLAYEGIRFDNAYSDCPVCIPARTTLITGIQAHHYGMPNYTPAFRIRRERDTFLGSLITRAGQAKYLYYVDDGAELLFDTRTDRQDARPLHGPKVDEMRAHLLAHLQAENHPHAEGGVLLNRHLPRPSRAEALAQDGAALAPLDGAAFAARHALHLNLEGPLFEDPE